DHKNSNLPFRLSGKSRLSRNVVKSLKQKAYSACLGLFCNYSLLHFQPFYVGVFMQSLNSIWELPDKRFI
ncbi:MAG: hypothetical protein QQN63_13570, partial [Nitrosopumilus sp.]